MRSGGFFAPEVQTFQAVLFVGAALSITAFPVLARIIYERGIAGTAMGSLALAAGALDDAAAWVILAIVLGSFTGNARWRVVAAVGGAALRRRRVRRRASACSSRFDALAEDHGSVPPWMFSIVLAALAAGAWFTDLVGIHSVFGAFILGAAMPHGVAVARAPGRIEPLTTALLVPLFFVYSGLNSRIGLVDSAWLWAVAGAGLRRGVRRQGRRLFRRRARSPARRPARR